MTKLWCISLIILLISGCTSKEEKAFMKVYEKNNKYNKYLQKTEKIQFYHTDENITKVLITATYLYKQKANEKKKEDERFVVGIYVDEDEIESTDIRDFNFSLNGKGTKDIKFLEPKSPYLKDISFVSEWTQFYLVSFPHIAKKDFNLEVSHPYYGKGFAHFCKVAKFILHKKAF